MKTRHIILATLCLAALPAIAADDKPAKPKKTPEEMLKMFDLDKDGSVSLDEFKKGMTGKIDAARIEETFKKKDKDGDGKLNAEEVAYIPPKPKPATPVKDEKKPAE